jgi:hypothetical protein
MAAMYEDNTKSFKSGKRLWEERVWEYLWEKQWRLGSNQHTGNQTPSTVTIVSHASGVLSMSPTLVIFKVH